MKEDEDEVYEPWPYEGLAFSDIRAIRCVGGDGEVEVSEWVTVNLERQENELDFTER